MASILRSLSTDKAPLVVTLFFAACGWVVQHSISQILASPTVVYTEDESGCGGRPECLTVTVKNITRSVQFHGLVFEFLCREEQQCRPITTKESVPPALDSSEPPDNQATSSTMPIGDLHPGWVFKFVTNYSGTSPPTFHLRTSNDPIRLSSLAGNLLVDHDWLAF